MPALHLEMQGRHQTALSCSASQPYISANLLGTIVDLGVMHTAYPHAGFSSRTVQHSLVGLTATALVILVSQRAGLSMEKDLEDVVSRYRHFFLKLF